MPAADGREVTVFDLGDSYVFKHYLGSDALFEAISDHYVSEEYRFEVPPRAFEEVREHLAAHGYDVAVVGDPEPYCVVVEQYEPHADVLRASVAHWSRRGHEFFLMPSLSAVERAVDDGATPVAETDLVAGI